MNHELAEVRNLKTRSNKTKRKRRIQNIEKLNNPQRTDLLRRRPSTKRIAIAADRSRKINKATTRLDKKKKSFPARDERSNRILAQEREYNRPTGERNISDTDVVSDVTSSEATIALPIRQTSYEKKCRRGRVIARARAR